MKLDYSALQKAIKSLEIAVNRSLTVPQDEMIRDAVIQRFEYTYELCWRMLKRQLEQEVPDPKRLDTLSFKDLIREALEKGISLDMPRWVKYRNERNISTHTYDEEKAQIVYQAAIKFLPDAKKLLAELLKRPHD